MTNNSPASFQALGLNDQLLQAVSQLGFTAPTQVQEIVIPKQLQENIDIVCLAQTGTGKTAAFGLPLIQHLDLQSPRTQALILCPTRELCRQISDDLTRYAQCTPGFTLTAVYGGSSIETQVRALRKGSHVIVATPGRMVDLLDRNVADLSHINRLILDEADEMLNMGFKEELDAIMKYCPRERRTLLFSATLPLEVERIAKQYMVAPQIITVGKRNQGADNVKHYYYIAQAKDRYLALKRIVDYYPDIYGIIFCRTRQETQQVSDALIRNGYNADALHGELSQAQRDLVMNRFRNRSLRLLVATDVAARGIDVNDLTHVINYNLPDEPEQYTHRSGRTGRADKTGQSIVIINSREQSKIKRIESILGKPFAQAKIPTGKEVCEKQLIHLIDQIEQTPVMDEINGYMDLIALKWEHLSKEELIQRVLSMEFNRFLAYYKNARDLNVFLPEDRDERKASRGDRRDGREGRGGRDGRGERRDGRGAREDSRQDERQDGRGARDNSRQDERQDGRGDRRDGRGNRRIQPEGPLTAGQRAPRLPMLPEKGFTFIRLNVGTQSGLTTRHVLRLLTHCGLGKHGIGRIDITRDACTAEVSSRAINHLRETLQNSDYKGKKLTFTVLDTNTPV